MAESPSPPNIRLALIGGVQTVLVAIFSAVVSLTFVAFIGAAVFWARSYALGLPPDQVVVALSQEQLVATGAALLTVAAVMGLLATALVYVFDPAGTPSRPTRLILLVLTGIALGAVIYYTGASGIQLIWAIGVVVVVLGAAGVLTVFFAKPEPDGDTPEPDGDAPEPEGDTPEPDGDARVNEGGEGSSKTSAIGAFFNALFSGFRPQPALKPQPAPKPQPQELSWELRLVQIAFFLAGGVAFWFVFREWWVVAAYSLAAGLYLVVLSVARASKENFIPYGIALFVASVVFSGGIAVLRASQASQVQPAVALPKEARNAVCGIFVGETSDRLYFGRLDNDREDAGPAHDGDSGHIFWLSKDEVTAWSVGTLQDQTDADSVLSALRPRVLADRRERRTIGVAITTEDKKRKVSKTRTVTKVPKAGGRAAACSVYTPEPQ